MEKELLGALHHHEHDTALAGPRLSPVVKLVAPRAGLGGGPTRRPAEIRCGHPVKHSVVAQARHVRGPALLESREQLLVGKSGIDPHGRHLAELVLHLVEQGQEEVGGTRGGVGVAVAQLCVEQIPRLADAGDQRMVDPRMVVPVVGRSRLMTLDLDRQRIEVHGQVAEPVAVSSDAIASSGKLQQRAAHDLPIAALGEHRYQSRQRRLRSEPVGHLGIVIARPLLGRPHLQWSHPTTVRHRQAKHRVVAQPIGVVVIPPSLPQKHKRGPHQL